MREFITIKEFEKQKENLINGDLDKSIIIVIPDAYPSKRYKYKNIPCLPNLKGKDNSDECIGNLHMLIDMSINNIESRFISAMSKASSKWKIIISPFYINFKEFIAASRYCKIPVIYAFPYDMTTIWDDKIMKEYNTDMFDNDFDYTCKSAANNEYIPDNGYYNPMNDMIPCNAFQAMGYEMKFNEYYSENRISDIGLIDLNDDYCHHSVGKSFYDIFIKKFNGEKNIEKKEFAINFLTNIVAFATLRDI